MQDFEMSGKNMNQLIENLVEITESMDTSYNQLIQLLERIEGGADWKGGTKSTFLAYMGLMKEYHRRFTEYAPEGCNNPLKEAQDALKKHGERVDSFYKEFPEYKKLEEIE